MQKKGLRLKGYILLGAITLLIIASASTIWHLPTANYPTHSDVFFMGVEAGALASVLLVYMFLTGFFLYRLIVSLKNQRV